ncbi:hypothetical protein ASF30_11900 [Leifsonia sp. Leaf264]|nr:hypothetical protein ASF30_11900 [Leifsonia sp. Leaf264]
MQQVANPFTTSAPAQLPAYSPGPSPVRQQQPQAPVRQQQPQAPVHHPQQEQPRTVAYLDDVRATAAVRYEEPTVAPINKFAIAALISAFFVPIIAVIFGHLALRDINGGKGEGRRMAVASLILGYFGIVWVTALAITFAAGILVVGAGGKIIIG